ncbi:MAG: hypothetical protein Unbinned8472contig1000_83 [Prokaryotic dsDNA virus sp.]|nr:MAG: hypothetical protein Unbinned8472contig1000_83 [Prokaryotic dsDNA virus sp.]
MTTIVTSKEISVICGKIEDLLTQTELNKISVVHTHADNLGVHFSELDYDDYECVMTVVGDMLSIEYVDTLSGDVVAIGNWIGNLLRIACIEPITYESLLSAATVE